MLDQRKFIALFDPLYSDIRPEHQFNVARPLLAHYTSMDVLEKIVTNNELWFSNPLFMNDLEELRFGILKGVQSIRESGALKIALGSEARWEVFLKSLDHYFREFEENHAFDTYVFCASQHDPNDNDGVLSMWRSYGGSGNGVAVVIDTAQLNVASPSTPLVLSKVVYASTQQRELRLREYCEQAAAIISANQVPEDQIHLVSFALFDRIKLFALFAKHKGFEEEHEWRAVYRHEVDFDKRYEPMFGYSLSSRGVEPKLKFRVSPVHGVTADDLSLEKIVNRIVLGPTTSSMLSHKSVVRMLNLLKHPLLADRVVASTIPLRPLAS
ncbi:MAG TPA: DUF2971 domain-containing protein [Rhizomicrobium sp.]|nr:DUF2971 domain-containing protein [Rhizomicrobium sp.]